MTLEERLRPVQSGDVLNLKIPYFLVVSRNRSPGFRAILTCKASVVP